MAKSQKDVENELKDAAAEIKDQEKVKITIPRDPVNRNKHVWISVNGQEYFLATGKEVEVPRVVAEVFQDSYNRTIEAEISMEKFDEI